jgi:hypothetical protein
MNKTSINKNRNRMNIDMDAEIHKTTSINKNFNNKQIFNKSEKYLPRECVFYFVRVMIRKIKMRTRFETDKDAKRKQDAKKSANRLHENQDIKREQQTKINQQIGLKYKQNSKPEELKLFGHKDVSFSPYQKGKMIHARLDTISEKINCFDSSTHNLHKKIDLMESALSEQQTVNQQMSLILQKVIQQSTRPEVKVVTTSSNHSLCKSNFCPLIKDYETELNREVEINKKLAIQIERFKEDYDKLAIRLRNSLAAQVNYEKEINFLNNKKNYTKGFNCVEDLMDLHLCIFEAQTAAKSNEMIYAMLDSLLLNSIKEHDQLKTVSTKYFEKYINLKYEYKFLLGKGKTTS